MKNILQIIFDGLSLKRANVSLQAGSESIRMSRFREAALDWLRGIPRILMFQHNSTGSLFAANDDCVSALKQRRRPEVLDWNPAAYLSNRPEGGNTEHELVTTAAQFAGSRWDDCGDDDKLDQLLIQRLQRINRVYSRRLIKVESLLSQSVG